ncbi:MAG TPA: polyphenol oxidase family protein [Chthoniobacterales bacterium]|nr:polyphenol oxidase family protein [Chthoniobacterales bacterium]
MRTQARVEFFPALAGLKLVRHAFIQRIPGIDVSAEKAEVLKRLDRIHGDLRGEIGIGDWPLLTAQQVHGNKIAVIDRAIDRDQEFAGCDGLITNQRRITLGIHAADCCVVYIVDPKTPVVGLVHSGKKGTELAVAGKAIQVTREHFGSNPADLIVQLSPCIRPPHYEIDFAAKIVDQLRAAGVKQIHDSGACTACDIDRYYSYRAEKGKTGRMLALLGLV